MAEATTLGPEYMGVRDTLKNKYNVTDDRIGYNPNTGYVTLDGQNIMRPTKNIDSTTYATQADFNSAAGAINQANQAYGIQQKALNPQSQPNPYDQQFQDYFKQLTDAINRSREPINAYGTPEYAAAQAQAQRMAQQGIRSAQESMGASGFGRSTRLSDRAQGIQNEANLYLETQALPQIINQIRNAKQAEIANLASLLKPIVQQQGVYDNRLTNEQNQAMKVLEYLTGRQDVQHERDYQAGRDKVTDEFAQKGLDMQMAALTGFLPDGTPTNAYQQQQLQNEWMVAQQMGVITPALAQLYGLPEGTPTFEARQAAVDNALKRGQLAVSQQNASTSAGQLSLAKDKFDFDKKREPDMSENEIYAEVVTELKKMTPNQRKNFFAGEEGNLIRDLGPGGYDSLYKRYFDEYGDPIQ